MLFHGWAGSPSWSLKGQLYRTRPTCSSGTLRPGGAETF